MKRYVYACSCSVYAGYTDNELFDELESSRFHRPTLTEFPNCRGAEQAVPLKTCKGEEFSVISLRKGTVSGYSPRTCVWT